MIVPSIDVMGGRVVQLIGGRDLELDAGAPLPLAQRFALAGEIAVVDLDAALSRGDARELITPLLKVADCRVGGGIRSVEAARAWLDAGATKVVLGTAARPEILRELPRERVIAALDAVHGEVVVDGWTRATGARIEERMAELHEHVGGFLVTFVEREGRMGGVNFDRVEALVAAARGRRVTIAGGVTTADDVARIDRLGADAQVGMALYKGALDLGDAIAAPLRSDRSDGLWPTVVVDEHGMALGLAWSDADSLRRAVAERRGIYRSRARGTWVKGETSGAVQELMRVDLDCDRDAIRFTVRQHGDGFCHVGTWTCFGAADGIGALARRLLGSRDAERTGSYTQRLLADPALLRAKLVEEAAELGAAATGDDAAAVVHETADVLYFALVALARSGASLADVERELTLRARRVTRRAGDAKEPR